MSPQVKTKPLIEKEIVSENKPLSIKELGALLVKHYKINEGFFDLLIEFKIGFGAVGPTASDAVPGAIIGVQKIGLAPAKEIGPSTIDASKVNPIRKKKEKTS